MDLFFIFFFHVCVFCLLLLQFIKCSPHTVVGVILLMGICYSFITLSFLLKGGELPVCIGCDQHLTIEHILLACSDLIEMRQNHFTYSPITMYVSGYFAREDL